MRDTKPRYDQKTFDPSERINKLQQIVSPVETDSGVTINQDAWLHLGSFEKDFSTNYAIKRKGNGVYVFVIEGDVTINNQKLNKRDGFGIWETDKFSITADSNSEILLIEVPMI